MTQKRSNSIQRRAFVRGVFAFLSYQVRIPMIPVSDSGDFDRASRAGYFLL